MKAPAPNLNVYGIKQDFRKIRDSKFYNLDGLYFLMSSVSKEEYTAGEGDYWKQYENCVFYDVRFQQMDFIEFSFKNCTFINCVFDTIDLTNSIFDNSSIFKCMLRNCTFNDFRLIETKIFQVNFDSCDFNKTLFSNSIIVDCTIYDSDLSGSKFIKNMINCLKITEQETVNDITFFNNTTFPEEHRVEVLKEYVETIQYHDDINSTFNSSYKTLKNKESVGDNIDVGIYDDDDDVDDDDVDVDDANKKNVSHIVIKSSPTPTSAPVNNKPKLKKK